MIKKKTKKTIDKKKWIYILTIFSYFLPVIFCTIFLPLIIILPLILVKKESPNKKEEKIFYPLKTFQNESSYIKKNEASIKKTKEKKWIQILNNLNVNFNNAPNLDDLQNLVKDYEDPLLNINLNGVDYNKLRQLPRSGVINGLKETEFHTETGQKLITAHYRNYIRLSAIGDGNCWWNAITILLVGKEDKEIATRLRVATALNIIKNAEDFFPNSIYNSDKIIEKDRNESQNNARIWRFKKIKNLIKDTRILENEGWTVFPDIVGYVSYTIKRRIKIIFPQDSLFLINQFPPANNRKKQSSYFSSPPFNIQYENKKLIKNLNKKLLEKESLSWPPFIIYHSGVNHFEAMTPSPSFTNSQSKNKKKVRKHKRKKQKKKNNKPSQS